MDEQTRRQLARRAAPYGLAALPTAGQYAYTDEHQGRVIQERWQRLCEQHGAVILGLRDVPSQPVIVQLDGVRWELGPLSPDEREVTAEVFNRLRGLQGANVPFGYWLWGEELPQQPQFRAPPAPRDPLLIGVIKTAPGRGLWVLVGRWFH